LAFFDPVSGFNRPTDGTFIYCPEPGFHPFEYVIAGRIFAAEFPEASLDKPGEIGASWD
jgi:hypothetical protein